MNRSIAIVGAPTNIGISTYDNGKPRELDRAPGVLRELGLAQRAWMPATWAMSSRPRNRDYVRPAGRVRNEAEVGGLELTIYDPGLDPDRSCAARLVSLLENVLLGVRSLNGRAA